jgi:hypothetical protein
LAKYSLKFCCAGAVVAEIEAAEEAGQTAKAEELRKAKRAEIIRKLRSLRRSAASPAKKKASTARGAAAKGGSHSAGSSSGGGEGDKPAGRAVVEEADVARIISAWTGTGGIFPACLHDDAKVCVQHIPAWFKPSHVCISTGTCSVLVLPCHAGSMKHEGILMHTPRVGMHVDLTVRSQHWPRY